MDGNEKLADGHQNVAGGANGLQVILHLITPLLRVTRHEGAAANTEARSSARLYRFLESCRGIVVGGVAFGVVGIGEFPESALGGNVQTEALLPGRLLKRVEALLAHPRSLAHKPAGANCVRVVTAKIADEIVDDPPSGASDPLKWGPYTLGE